MPSSGSETMSSLGSATSAAGGWATQWWAGQRRWCCWRLAAMVVCQVGLVQPANAQVTDGSPTTSHVGPEQADRYRTGPRLGVDLTYGWPFFGGGAAEVWKERAPDQVDSGPGLSLRLGYDMGRLGVTGGLELYRFSAGDSVGGAEALTGLLHWRPDIQIGNTFESVITAGYVHKTAGRLTFDVTYPEGLCVPSVERLGCRVTTSGNGLRIGLGVESPGAAKLAVGGNFFLDLISFRHLEANGLATSFSSPGWSVWPLLAIGLEWRPF